MKVAIKFGDNDFHGTFIGVLEFIFNTYKYNEVIPTTDELVDIINEVSFGIYKARQNDYKNESNHFISQNIKDYLKIDSSQILLNKEVDYYIKSMGADSDNGETFILDTDLDFPGNKVTYSI